MNRIDLTLADSSKFSIIHKYVAPSSRSSVLGLPREASFYSNFAPLLLEMGMSLPKVYNSEGSFETGEKSLYMEDLCYCVPSGFFFEKHSPLNWTVNLQEQIQRVIPEYTIENPTISSKKIAHAYFFEGAKLHARFWLDSQLPTTPWLRGRQYLAEEGREGWLAAQKISQDFWIKLKEKGLEKDISGISWDPFLVSCLDASFEKISFDDFLLEHAQRPWTLVHGDFHPGNFLWEPSASDPSTSGRIVLLDWEMVGVGSGPQDLAQSLISHMKPAVRRECEEELLRAYYDQLLSLNPSVNSESRPYPYEHCLRDYVEGGAGRWIWFVPYLAAMCPPPMGQYFHDQLLSFLQDHGLSPENIPMPRV